MTEETSLSGVDESIWSSRVYHLRPSEFATAMLHYYRAEIQRSNTWRMRLDNTTNWAIVTQDPQAISDKIIKEMKRGGTLCQGKEFTRIRSARTC